MDKNIITPLHTYEQFKLNEETLDPVKQPQILKVILKSFDLQDMKYYLKGMMIDLDITTRKRLVAWIEDGKYRQVINALIQHNENDPIAVLKLKKIYKVIYMEVKAGADVKPEETV